MANSYLKLTDEELVDFIALAATTFTGEGVELQLAA